MSAMHDKIAALLNVGKEGSGATEAERDNAMRLAAMLMLKHNISEKDVLKDDDKPRMTRGKEFEAELAWHEQCVWAAQELYAVKSLWVKDRFVFIGRADNVDAAQMTYNYLVWQVEQEYKYSLPKGLSKTERAQYRRQFKFACAQRVYARAWRIAEGLRRGSQDAQAGTGSTALVIVEARKGLETEVNDFLESLTKGIKAGKAKSVAIKKDTRGAQDGFRAGDRVQLNRSIA